MREVTYRDLVNRYGEETAYDMLLSLEKSANIENGSIYQDNEGRLKRIIDSNDDTASVVIKDSSNDNGKAKSAAFVVSSNIYVPAIEALRLNLQKLSNEEPYLNKLERQSIQSLIFFLAYENDVKETFFLKLLEERFGARDVKELRKKDFDAVIRYLIDLVPPGGKN